ncbi:prepilin-type N-terminal cleavage/methylation domain-containing protein [Yersinia rochesterensis]|uniref:prepilin-type N-terminal cleavage/methylation domain-containing protein n=1 Tax=Yersinia rochesterensis TaxID=1604335 RepID=UPI0011A1B547|nr:prepilin-type N-terminal cleavage/methylation domain-containing protein [Yersinia rochesterensis]
MSLARYHYTKKLEDSHSQQGFSLPEALIAALFFSVSLLGLLQYHQALLQGFSSLWQQRQAWSLLNQHIESSGGEPTKALTLGMKPNWQYHQLINRIDGECTEFTFILKMQSTQQVELSRWFCIVSEGG